MLTTIKRTLCVLLSMALILSAFGGLGLNASALDSSKWTYTASGNTITATYADAGVIEPQTMTLSLSAANDREYDGTPTTAVITLSNGWSTENGLLTPSIWYSEIIDGEMRPSTQTAPSDAGDYVASAVVYDYYSTRVRAYFSIRRASFGSDAVIGENGYLVNKTNMIFNQPGVYNFIEADYTGAPQQIFTFGSDMKYINGAWSARWFLTPARPELSLYACVLPQSYYSDTLHRYVNSLYAWDGAEPLGYPPVSKTPETYYSTSGAVYDIYRYDTVVDLIASHGTPSTEPFTNDDGVPIQWVQITDYDDPATNPALMATEPGEYSVWFFIDGGRNYESFWSSYSGRIDPLPAEDAVLPTGLTAVYGERVRDVILPHGWQWEDRIPDFNTMAVGSVGIHTFEAINKMYGEYTTFNVPVTVTKATPSVYAPNAYATFGQTLTDVSLPAGWTWVDGMVRVGNVGSSASYAATYTPDDTANYDTVTKNVTVYVQTKKTLTVIADPITKTAGEADPALTYTVEGLLVGDTLTGALTRAAGEEPGTYAISLGSLSAGGNYDIQFTGASFTIEDGSAPHDQQSVTIDDQISANFLLDLDAREDVHSVQIAYVDPTTGNVTNTVAFTDLSGLEKQDDLYKIPVDVAPAKLGDTIIVTIEYAEGETDTLSTSVADYCRALMAGDYDQTVKDLAAASLEYGQAANDFFAEAGSCAAAELGGTAGAMAAVDTVSTLPGTMSVPAGKIASVSFMALTKPEFRFYMKDMTEAQAAALNRTIAVDGSANARFVKNAQGNILLEVTGIEAETMDEIVTVTIDDWTITFCGNDFARIMAGNTRTAVLGAALYNYGAAAKACFRVPTVGDDMEVNVGIPDNMHG